MKYYDIVDGVKHGPESIELIEKRKLAGQIPVNIELIQATEKKKSSNANVTFGGFLSNFTLADRIFSYFILAAVLFSILIGMADNMETGAVLLFIVALVAFCWWICGVIAAYKRLDVISYKILGLLLGFLAIVIVLAIPRRERSVD